MNKEKVVKYALKCMNELFLKIKTDKAFYENALEADFHFGLYHLLNSVDPSYWTNDAIQACVRKSDWDSECKPDKKSYDIVIYDPDVSAHDKPMVAIEIKRKWSKMEDDFVKLEELKTHYGSETMFLYCGPWKEKGDSSKTRQKLRNFREQYKKVDYCVLAHVQEDQLLINEQI